MENQPAGGFGGEPSREMGLAPSPEKKARGGAGLLLLLGLLVGLGVMGVIAIAGIRKYITGAKTAEAIVALGHIGKDAALAYEAEPLDGSWATSVNAPVTARPKHGLCASTQPVPSDFSSVTARKYQSTAQDWASWRCLKFEMDAPQYYQYRYERVVDGFNATAQGDLDGDGIRSTYELEGKVVGDELRVAPQIKRTNEDE